MKNQHNKRKYTTYLKQYSKTHSREKEILVSHGKYSMTGNNKKSEFLQRFKGLLNAVPRKISGQNIPTIFYVALVMILTIFALIISSTRVQAFFLASNFCKSKWERKRCSSIVGYGGVQRIFLAHALFHMVLAAVTTELWIVEKWREKIHGQFWSIKVLVLSVSVLGCLLIQSGTVFDVILSYFGYIFASIFIVLQLLVFLMLLHKSLDYLVPDMQEMVQETLTKPRSLLYHSIISILYLFSLLLLIYFFLLFVSHSSCQYNLTFLCYILVHCILISILACFSRIENGQSQKGVPKTLLCVLYVLFTSWLAMRSSTQQQCNPFLPAINSDYSGIHGSTILSLAILSLILLYIAHDPVVVIGELHNFFTCEFRLESVKCDEKQMKNSPKKETITEDIRAKDQENNKVSYSCSGQHIFMFLLSCYIMTALQNWSKAELAYSHVTYKTSRSAMFFLMSATLVCLWVFTWILVKPVLLSFLESFGERLIDDENMTENITPGVSGIDDEPKNHAISNHINEKDNCNGGGLVTVKERADNKLSDPKRKNEHASRNIDKAKLKHKTEYDTESEKVYHICDIESRLATEKGGDDLSDGNEVTLSDREKEMMRLQDKVLRLQEKIGKLQYRVSVLQGVSL